MLIEIEVGENEEFYDFDNYITKLGEVNRLETVVILNDYSVFYSLTKTNVFKLLAESLVFTFNN